MAIGKNSPLERVTVNFTDRAWRAVLLSVQLTGDTRTDVLNQDAQLGAYLRWIESRGGQILVQGPGDRKPYRIQLLPGGGSFSDALGEVLPGPRPVPDPDESTPPPS